MTEKERAPALDQEIERFLAEEAETDDDIEEVIDVEFDPYEGKFPLSKDLEKEFNKADFKAALFAFFSKEFHGQVSALIDRFVDVVDRMHKEAVGQLFSLEEHIGVVNQAELPEEDVSEQLRNLPPEEAQKTDELLNELETLLESNPDIIEQMLEEDPAFVQEFFGGASYETVRERIRQIKAARQGPTPT